MTDTVTVHITQESQTTSKGTARGHEVLSDRPLHMEGTDLGPMGGELFLMGLGGCFISNLLAAIRTRQAPVSNVHLTVTATKAGTPVRFTAIELRISADCEDRALMEKLVSIAENGCLVANSIKSAIDLSLVIDEDGTDRHITS